MQLFGNYLFEKLRECFQGVFGFQVDPDSNEITLDLWQLRVFIIPGVMVELRLATSAGYKSIGFLDLHS